MPDFTIVVELIVTLLFPNANVPADNNKVPFIEKLPLTATVPVVLTVKLLIALDNPLLSVIAPGNEKLFVPVNAIVPTLFNVPLVAL